MDNIEEAISALMDNELSAEEAKIVIEAIKKDPSLQAKWENYHLISANMTKPKQGKRKLVCKVEDQLAMEVKEALQKESTIENFNEPCVINTSSNHQEVSKPPFA